MTEQIVMFNLRPVTILPLATALLWAGALGAAISPAQPLILKHPGPAYQDGARGGGMVIGMERSPGGRLWGCWTGTGDKPDGYFLIAKSDDGGRHWSKPLLVVGPHVPDNPPRIGGALVGNLWCDPKGRLWLFFDQQLGDPEQRIGNWHIRCDNPDAADPTWSKPLRFAEGCSLNKPTVLSNGDWLLPVSDWQRKTARVFAFDHGKQAWLERGHLQFPDWEFDEHSMVELRDGRLWMLARTKGSPHESFSSDGGRHWSKPQRAAHLDHINARFFLRRLSSGNLLLVKHGQPLERLNQRSHLSAWLSADDGQTWKGGLMLDARKGVSYPDGVQSPDGLIHIIHDYNRHSDAEILLSAFREADVLAGKLQSADGFLARLINKASGPKPEILPNGIELPQPWPPQHRDPTSLQPMPLPYLSKPPRLLPITQGRQLFVDDFLIAKTTLKRRFHQPEKAADNPVFKPETPRELGPSTQGEREQYATTFTGQGGLFYDPTEGCFKLFHVAGWRGALSLATSQDLRHWTRRGPLLPEGIDWRGPKLQNSGSDNCLWLDLNSSDPAARLKFLTCWMHAPKDKQPPGFSHSLHLSDGTQFSPATPISKRVDDYCSFFYNPFRQRWVFSIKQGTVHGRSRFYHESPDFLGGADWSQAVYWTHADQRDQPEPAGRYPGAGDAPQLYSLNAVAYESLMVGMHYIHRGPRNEICDRGQFPKLVDLEIGFSRDGFHWDRPQRGAFIQGSRTEGSWDRAYLHGAAGVFVILKDQLVFPYMGTSGIAPNGKRGMYTGGSIGLATLRRDGFASMDGPGELLTRPLKHRGSHLFVNLKGKLRVEALDSRGKVLCRSAWLEGDNTKAEVIWENEAQLPESNAGPLQLRFELEQGSLYSFWITKDPAGSSGGYLGGGGPGYPGVQDLPFRKS